MSIDDESARIRAYPVSPHPSRGVPPYTIVVCDRCHAPCILRGAWSERDVLLHSGYVRGDGKQHLCGLHEEPTKKGENDDGD